MLKVLILETLEPEALQTLRDTLSGEAEIVLETGLPAHPDYEVLVAGHPGRRFLEASPNLRLLVIPWAGLPAETRALLAGFPHLAVHNLHYNAALTAELALALLLSAAKWIVPFDSALRRHDWSPRYQPNPSLALEGKTALILGFGQIGRRIGRVCAALGMSVLAIRRNPHQPLDLDYPAEVHGPESLPDLLPRAQVLLISLPATPETEGLIGEQELRLMPPGGLLVNVGRGAIVDQAALYHALKDRHLAAAGLDVWYSYPPSEAARSHTPPAAYPFHELENLVMSPHRGGASRETDRLLAADLARLLQAAAHGQPIPNRVDPQAGY